PMLLPPQMRPRTYAAPLLAECLRCERDNAVDFLMKLAAEIEPDGGMPGKDDEERWLASAAVLLYFMAKGHTVWSGAFRVHVKRLLEFLQSAPSTAADPRKQRLVELAEKGTVLSGRWEKFARQVARGARVGEEQFWREVERALSLLP
ncbi:MAG: hypothetical protein N3B01_08210, partial [Verrucomicrobiae bacterium]|nr:hypothetical protein [Verrucomicrobiae bacterium]